MHVEQRINSVPRRTPKRRPRIFGTSAAAVAAIVIVAGGLYAVSNHTVTPKTDHPGVATASHKPPVTNDTSQPPQQEGFNYNQYLPFTPLLPSYTAGHQLTHSIVIRYLNMGHNGNAISYSASYENAFTITEGLANQLHFAPLSTTKTHVTLGNNIHATIQKHDGGESIDFTQHGLLFDVTTTNGGMRLQDLEKVCASISVPATQTPSEIHESDNGPQAATELNFNPIKAGQFYVPSGYSLNVQGSAINIKGNSKSELFQITYRKGSSYLTVTQSIGSQPEYNTAYHSTMIHDVNVLEQHANSMEPVAVFTLPQTQVHVVVDSNISSGEVSKVLNSFLNTAMNNASH